MIKNFFVFAALLILGCNTTEKKEIIAGDYTDQHRPQIHFTPKTGWMNDPNGMVYVNGTYHLSFQHYPDSTVWGPMHWGHATSTDMVHWKEQPIALYPDSLGYIFSGSAVVDEKNTSGFGKDGKAPLVAIFTHHNMAGEKANTNTFQNQSIAYSLDDGATWTKYDGNPVLKNPGIRDFRDPKVHWNEQANKWIMTLATKDRITFYSSPNFKDWAKESEFGSAAGSHGGVWECPDLFTLDYNGQKVWVLIVSIGSGGPNGGSATQYFTGSFDGHTFTPNHTDTKWIDYGPDDYAGITWSNTGDRKIFLGWMSNWQYANLVPTVKWRSAMTVPRELGIEKVSDKWLVTSTPVKELSTLEEKATTINDIAEASLNLTEKLGKLNGPAKIALSAEKMGPFTLTLSNDAGEKLAIGYDASLQEYFIDRSQAGKIDFEKGFGKKHTSPRLSGKPGLEVTLLVDNSSVELFADGGLSVMSELFFPNESFTNMLLQLPGKQTIQTLQYTPLKSSWK